MFEEQRKYTHSSIGISDNKEIIDSSVKRSKTTRINLKNSNQNLTPIISKYISSLNTVLIHFYKAQFLKKMMKYHKNAPQIKTIIILLKQTIYLSLYKLFLTFITKFKLFERDISIKKTRRFHSLIKLFIFRNFFIDVDMFYTLKRIIKLVYFKNWKNQKYEEDIIEIKKTNCLRKIIIPQLNIKEETYINIYQAKYFFKKCKRLNLYCDIMFNKSIRFLKLIIYHIKRELKDYKCKFIISLEINLSNEDIQLFKNTMRKRLKDENSKCQFNKPIKGEMNPYSIEYIKYIILSKLHSIINKKKYINKYKVKIFYEWHFRAIKESLLNYNKDKKRIIEHCTVVSIVIFKKIINIQISFYFKFFILRIKQRVLKRKYGSILSFELMENENLLKVIKGMNKLLHYKLHLLYNKIEGKYKNKLHFFLLRWKTIINLNRNNKCNSYYSNKKYNILCECIKQYNRMIIYKHKRFFFRIFKSIKSNQKQIERRIILAINILFNKIFFLNRWNNKIFFLNMIIKNINKKRMSQIEVNQSYKNIFNYTVKNYINLKIFKDKRLFFTQFKRISFNQSLFSFGNSPKNNISNIKVFELNKFQDVYNKMNLLLKVIYSFSFSTFITIFKNQYFKPIPHPHFIGYKKPNNQTINHRIIENMSIVALSIHHEIMIKTKQIKLYKVFSLIGKKTQYNKIKRRNLNYYFSLWKTSLKLINNAIIEEKEFQRLLKLKIINYEQGIEALENKLSDISLKAEQCKKCSVLLKMSTLSAVPHQMKKEIIPPEGNMDNDDDDLDDIDLLDDDLDGADYYEYLVKTENEIKNNIEQIKNTKKPICNQLKKEVEELYMEIKILTGKRSGIKI